MLEDASIKLSAVASSLTTVSARAMLAAMIAGERDPRVLADLAKGKMRAKIPQLTEALTGSFDDHHARLARAILRRPELVEEALVELDDVIAEACRPWAHQLELLQTIPGVGEKVAQVILAETGGDMSRFPSAAHLAAWAGVAPGAHESAGKRHPVPARHGNKWLTAMLVEAAGSVGRNVGAPTTWPPSTPGSPPAAAWAAPRSQSPTRSSSRPTGCHPRRALPRPRPGLAGPTQRRGPRPPACRATLTPRPRRGPRPSRLTELQKNWRTGSARPR
jgi:hypothetical protein